jgi:hypothetical protein
MINVGFEVLRAVVMKCSIFWDITTCSPLKINRRFGGICRLHIQGRRISQARNQREAGSNQWLACFTFHSKDGGDLFRRNVG